MKVFLWVLFLISLFSGGIQTISKVNRYAKEAAQAYRQQDYATAIASYEYLLNDLEVQDDQISLNLAHSYYKANLLEQSLEQYQQLANHPFQHIRAVAALQIGNIAAQQRKYKKALGFYKQALIAEPANESARYNYELLKKYLALHPENEEEKLVTEDGLPEATEAENQVGPPPVDEQLAPRPKMKPDAEGTEREEIDSRDQSEAGTPENSGQTDQPTGQNSPENTENGAKEKEQAAGQDAGDTEGLKNVNNQDRSANSPRASSEAMTEEDQRAQTRRSRLQQMNISPEKAQLLLDAMQSAELQYIQQLPKKATKKPDKSKPDW